MAKKFKKYDPADYPLADKIKAGAIFNTRAEVGCIVVSQPDFHGNFVANDSDGIECEFHVGMVVSVSKGA